MKTGMRRFLASSVLPTVVLAAGGCAVSTTYHPGYISTQPRAYDQKLPGKVLIYTEAADAYPPKNIHGVNSIYDKYFD